MVDCDLTWLIHLRHRFNTTSGYSAVEIDSLALEEKVLEALSTNFVRPQPRARSKNECHEIFGKLVMRDLYTYFILTVLTF